MTITSSSRTFFPNAPVLRGVVGTLVSTVDDVSIALQGAQGAGGRITGAYTGSPDFYLSCDNGVTYERTVVLFTPLGSSGTPRVVDSIGSNTQGNFQFLFLSGATHVRVLAPTWASGTVTVQLFTTPATSGEVTTVGVEGINGPQSPRFVTVGGIDNSANARGLKLPAAKINFRDLGAVQAIKTTSGSLFGLHIENNQGAAAWIQVFDAAAPTLGTTNPDIEFLVAANGSKDFSLPTQGVQFNTAIRIGSTTGEKGAATSAAGVIVWAFFV